MKKRIRKKVLLKKPSNKDKVDFWMKACSAVEEKYTERCAKLMDELATTGLELCEQKKISANLADKNLELVSNIGRLLKENSDLKRKPQSLLRRLFK